MFKITFLASAFVLNIIFLSPSNAQNFSVNELLKTCSQEQSPFCIAYISAAISGIRWGADTAAYNSGFTEPNAMRKQAKLLLGTCIPAAATGNQLHEIALKYMRNYPKSWHQPAVVIIHRAMVVTYPCR